VAHRGQPAGDADGAEPRRPSELIGDADGASPRSPAITAEELTDPRGYSGWGGLSIEKVQSQLPPELVPETFGLIHEYYTPPRIAEGARRDAVPAARRARRQRRRRAGARAERRHRAAHPRVQPAPLPRARGRRPDQAIAWTAVEFSKVSSTLLRALRPDVDLYHMPFERWIREESARLRGTISLIVSNPPYGERGAMAREDPDEFYKEKRAYAYFMRRALDLLVPAGSACSSSPPAS
jgi:hypothetical protein